MNHTLTCKYIYSVLLCLGFCLSSTPVWTKTRYGPTGVLLGIDVLRPFHYKYYGQKGIQYELDAFMNFASFILEGDYGWGDIRWEGCNTKTGIPSSYTSDGKYFRIGLHYNLIQDTPNKNMAFLGFRYAKSFFKDHLTSKIQYRYSDTDDGLIENKNPSIDSTQDNVEAHWFEAVAGVKVKVWKLLYVGSTIRYKFGLSIDHADTHVPYDVLGWGLNDGKGPFGFSLYLSIRIPFVYNA